LGHETAAHQVNWTSKSRDVHQTLLDGPKTKKEKRREKTKNFNIYEKD
jgi:hypothetical protein